MLPAADLVAQEPPSLDRFGLLIAAQSRPSFAVLGAGARAAGMGGAFTALADDASAASFNPAGLALLVTPEFSFVLDGRSRRDQHRPFTALLMGERESFGGSESRFSGAGVNFASFTLPFTVADRNFCLQLSYHRLIDLDFASDRTFIESGEDGAAEAAFHQRVSQSGDVDVLSLAAAYQITPRLSFGLTVARWQGGWSFNTATEERGLETPSLHTLSYSQTNAWSGWNLNAGVLLRYRYLNIGFATRLEFRGDYRVNSELETNFATPFAPRSTFDGTLDWPNSSTLGLALKPFETWIITGDYAVYDWDEMVIRGLGAEPVSFFDLQPVSQSATRGRGQWRVGTEWTLLPGSNVVGLRAGYATELRPEQLTREARTTTRVLSAGIGFRRGPLSIDLAWQRVNTDEVQPEFVDPDALAEGEVLLPANAAIESHEDRLLLSALYRFPSRAALGKLFHFLFVGPNEPAKP